MLDIKFIRENKELITAGAKKKRIDFDVNELVVADDKRREILASIEKKRAEQNGVNEKMAKIGTGAATPAEREIVITEMKALKESIQKEEEQLKEIMKEWQALMLRVPNLPDMTVPEGESDKDNREVRTWGEIPSFSFKPKSHIELMEALDLVDFERGAKLAGFRGYVLKNDAVLLNFALGQHVLEKFVKKGFEPMMVPSLVKRDLLLGTGYLPQGEEDLYHTQDNDYLAGTAEVAAMGYYSGDVLDRAILPKKIIAWSPAYRREAGAHGKDTKGIFRVHEFYKFEQIVLCEADHQVSVNFHEELTLNAEELMQELGLPYHVVANCGGDLGLGQVKKYDIEVWLPFQETYRETHSASYFHDFQTRRLNIKYRDAEGKMKFAHSLNNTAAANTRLLIAIIENYQQADGTIRVPEVLQKYMGKAVIQKRAV